MVLAQMGGVFSAVVTPTSDRLTADIPKLVRHCHELLEQGCHGLAVLGTTGEANSIGLSERRRILDALIEGGIAPASLIPGTGACAVDDAVILSRHALSLGIKQLVMLPPYYYKQPPEQGIIEYYTNVIDSMDNQDLKIVLYHIPQMSMVPIPRSVIEALYLRFGSIIAGIKDSSGDLSHMTALAKDYPWLAVFAGADPLMLPLLRAGGAGCITATSNLVADALRFIYDHHTDAAQAEAIERAQSRIVAFRTLSNRHAQIATIKAMIAARYQEPDWNRVWPPLVALNGSQATSVAQTIDEIERSA